MTLPKKKISVVGLGFVGLSIAVVNASKGFYTFGIDADIKKVKNLKIGSFWVEIYPFYIHFWGVQNRPF